MKTKYFGLFIFLFILAVILILREQGVFDKFQQKNPEVSKFSESRSLMGTFVSVDVCSVSADSARISKAYQGVWERLGVIAWQMNVYDDKSDVVKINHSNLQLTEVHPDTYALIKRAIHFTKLTNGSFDITIWPLMKIWMDAQKQNGIPTEKSLSSAQAAVGAHHIALGDNNQIKLNHLETKIDLGGIAKGYAIDEVARILREHQIEHFFIDAGGDIYAGGYNCEGKPWRVGIRDPRDRSKIIDIVGVSNLAVTTSGDYERYFQIDNQQYSHIINPVTGHPQKEIVSATVIAAKAEDADALSTSLCVLGSKEGTALIESLKMPYASMVISKAKGDKIMKFTSQSYSSYRITNDSF